MVRSWSKFLSLDVQLSVTVCHCHCMYVCVCVCAVLTLAYKWSKSSPITSSCTLIGTAEHISFASLLTDARYGCASASSTVSLSEGSNRNIDRNKPSPLLLVPGYLAFKSCMCMGVCMNRREGRGEGKACVCVSEWADEWVSGGWND